MSLGQSQHMNYVNHYQCVLRPLEEMHSSLSVMHVCYFRFISQLYKLSSWFEY